MTIMRDFSAEPASALLEALWHSRMPRPLVWRLERWLAWLLPSLGFSGKAGEERSPAASQLSLEVVVSTASLGLLDDLIQVEIEERTPFGPDDVVVTYQLTPLGQEVKVGLAISPSDSALPEEADASPNLLQLVRTPVGMACLTLVAIPVVAEIALEQRVSSRKADIENAQVMSRGAAREAAALRDQLDQLTLVAHFPAARREARMQRIELLQLLTETLPDSAWLGQLDVAGQTVRLSGYALSAASVLSSLNDLSQVQSPQFVSPISLDDRGLEQFAVEFTLAEGTSE